MPASTVQQTESAHTPQQVLSQVFGFEQFREGQEEVVRRLLDGRSAVAIFPTGSGKSLCYQLPALLLDGLTVVISPLIALMKDQIDFLQSRGISAARLDSSLGREETLQVYEDLRAGKTRLLYISPERLGNERFLQLLERQRISLLAVDEAHCISEWGHNFRPDYLKIADLARRLRVERVLALTATATPDVAADIAEAFDVYPGDTVHTGFYRPNLELHVTPSTDESRKQILIDRLRERPTGPAVVYVTLQRTAEQIAGLLASQGFSARAYHAGMKSEDRTEVQEAFMASDDMIVVATIAFGMGIDKANIRAVYHYNLPKSLENYQQEIGRAGRDGKRAFCELLACRDDLITLQNFTYGDTPTPEAVHALVEEILNGGPRLEISVYDLSSRHDVRDLVVKTLLTYLELEGILESTGPFYTEYRFQPHKPSVKILERFDSKRAEFLKSIFQSARKGKTWFSLDVAETGRKLNQSRDRIVAALDYLDQLGDITLQAAGVRLGYRLAKQNNDLQNLVSRLNERFQRREQQDIARIRRVVALAECTGCLPQSLLEYFGEECEACGTCCRCRGTAASPLPAGNQKPLTAGDRQLVEKLVRERQSAWGTPRQLARFLCGITSPATTKAKLRKRPEFGQLDTVPFADVLSLVEEVMPAG